MIDPIEDLVEILDYSIEKHGERPLTNTWLRALLRKTIDNHYRQLERDSDYKESLAYAAKYCQE